MFGFLRSFLYDSGIRVNNNGEDRYVNATKITTYPEGDVYKCAGNSSLLILYKHNINWDEHIMHKHENRGNTNYEILGGDPDSISYRMIPDTLLNRASRLGTTRLEIYRDMIQIMGTKYFSNTDSLLPIDSEIEIDKIFYINISYEIPLDNGNDVESGDEELLFMADRREDYSGPDGRWHQYIYWLTDGRILIEGGLVIDRLGYLHQYKPYPTGELIKFDGIKYYGNYSAYMAVESVFEFNFEFYKILYENNIKIKLSEKYYELLKQQRFAHYGRKNPSNEAIDFTEEELKTVYQVFSN